MSHRIVFGAVALVGLAGAILWSAVDDTPGPLLGYVVGLVVGHMVGGPDTPEVEPLDAAA